MAINTITYTNKVTLNENASIADVNKCKASDMNEIKNVVNANANLVGDLSNLDTTDKSSVVNAINEIIDNDAYSTNEIKTNKVWTDGKPVYRKVIDLSNFAVASGTSYTHNIANIDKIVNISAYMQEANGATMPYPLIAHSGAPLNVYISPTNISWAGTDSWGAQANRHHVFIIEYTKTTD